MKKVVFFREIPLRSLTSPPSTSMQAPTNSLALIKFCSGCRAASSPQSLWEYNIEIPAARPPSA
tara:strand:- start:192 stop:383 length:192 start_codon:yes stop_codon:yes gene_type:complete